MKIPIPCNKCVFPEDGSDQDMTLYSLPVRDDNTYRLICRRGHETTTIAQEEKLEVLFEIAINAIADGYNREAIASATASLERFHEFAIAVVCDTHKINPVEFSTAWKSIKNQSERQLGAYIFSHVLHFSKAPPLLSSELAGFRNEVIHKGKIPERTETIRYLNAIIALINPALLNLKKSTPSSVHKIGIQSLLEAHKRIGQVHTSTMGGGTLISTTLSHDSPHALSIEERLLYIERRKYRG